MMDKLTNSAKINNALHRMGIYSFYDVIKHVPRKYEDLHLTHDRNLIDKEKVVLFGKVISLVEEKSFSRVKIVQFNFLTNSNTLYKVVAFNRTYLTKVIYQNMEITLSATYSKKDNSLNYISHHKGQIHDDFIKSIYSLPEEINSYQYSLIVKNALKNLKGKLYSNIPFKYINKYRLGSKEYSYEHIHFPLSINDAKRSYRLLKYEEALFFTLRNQIIKEGNRSLNKVKKEPIDLDICEPLLKTLPYELTSDQEKAIKEILNDMNEPYLMYRLLQGDVGSGKTIVSFIALYANYYRGDMGALMAPTEALAKQHYENAKKLFSPLGIKVSLLTGSESKINKEAIKHDLSEGDIDIIIGTHALFSKGLTYSKLGLVVIDEQHRFGVNQRAMLLGKGKNADLLMMSATPIPRSFALTLFGDLDVSTIYEFPNKVRNVETKVINSNLKEIFSLIDDTLKTHRQIYVIAPLIQAQENRTSVEKLFDEYQAKYHGIVGLLHGKMDNFNKNKVLEDFKNGVIKILISTQVIEVGIDVKNASAMIIYDANNLGLASLHQLRGRVGRDGSKATCLLICDDEESQERLNILENTNDGFKISEEDMRNRGPGELSGIRQSGLPEFRYINVIEDVAIFVAARNDAKAILNNLNDKANAFIVDKIKLDLENESKLKA